MPQPPSQLNYAFPEVSYEAWREQVQKDLKGVDFDKRLLTRTLEGIVVQPLYTSRDVTAEPDAAGFAGLPPYRRGSSSTGRYAERWDLRVEQRTPEPTRARGEITEDLAGGANSLWLRCDALTRLGASQADAASQRSRATKLRGGVAVSGSAALAELLADVDLAKTPLHLDAGAAALPLAAALLAVAEQRGVPVSALRVSFGCDPLGALAADGALPHDLATARALAVELARYAAGAGGQLRALQVSTLAYHDAGASGSQELGYAFATGVEYLRWSLAGGLTIDQAASQIGFTVGVAGDLFMELAKLRALRLGWSKIVAAFGGAGAALNTSLHAVCSSRTKTERDPWVNLLRTTTEAFAAMVGGADAVTTRGFDEVIGLSDSFSRRIARNTQIILNEEAYVTRVADAAGGSYYVEAQTEGLAREGWKLFQEIERRSGMSEALRSGAIAAEIAELAGKRAGMLNKRSLAITGVSEFANLAEEPLQRTAAEPASGGKPARPGAQEAPDAKAALDRLRAAQPQQLVAAAVAAARAGANSADLLAALSGGAPAAPIEPLPLRRHAEPFEALRSRSQRHAAASGSVPCAFLCNLGPIPKHKARSAFATGFFNAGGIQVLDNDGFATPEEALAGFASSKAPVAVICGSDDQYPEWLPKIAAGLRERGAREVVLAGRPGEHEASFREAGVSQFIYLGVDVVATLSQLLDRMGVKP
jgi:methylmalonyl-CoA mutase